MQFGAIDLLIVLDWISRCGRVGDPGRRLANHPDTFSVPTNARYLANTAPGMAIRNADSFGYFAEITP